MGIYQGLSEYKPHAQASASILAYTRLRFGLVLVRNYLPLALTRALVMFEPKVGGRLSYGVTDAKGFYSLEYSMEQMGAEVGVCEVSVKTGARADDAGNPAVPEKVPAKYFKQKIEVEVAKKSNTIDIALSSK